MTAPRAGPSRARDVEVCVTSHAQEVLDADRVVLPGQGHMGDCMRELAESGLLPAVPDAAVPVVAASDLLTFRVAGQGGRGAAAQGAPGRRSVRCPLRNLKTIT